MVIARSVATKQDARIEDGPADDGLGIDGTADALTKSGQRGGFIQTIRVLRRNPMVTILPPTPKLFEAGIELYESRPDKDWSLTDCISFVVMAEREITEALTGDQHFEQAGLKALLR